MSTDAVTALVRSLLGSAAGWRDDAACTAADPERFAPRGELGPHNEPPMRATAADYCAGCPVRHECLGFAEGTNAQGVWGGEYRHTVSGRRPSRVSLLGAPRFPRKSRKAS